MTLNKLKVNLFVFLVEHLFLCIKRMTRIFSKYFIFKVSCKGVCLYILAKIGLVTVILEQSIVISDVLRFFYSVPVKLIFCTMKA